MDISQIIIRQTYLIPKGDKELELLIIDELNKNKGICTNKYKIDAWTLDAKHGNTITFWSNMVYEYIQDNIDYGLELNPQIDTYNKEIKKVANNQWVRNRLAHMSNCSPHKITVDILASEPEGYRIEVECLPILYFNVTKNKYACDDIDIQDAQAVCQRLLKTIFVGALNGTIASEGKPLKPNWNKTELLINDVKIHEISKSIEEALDSATNEVLIMTWMGTILLTKLRELKEKGVKIRVITGIIKDIRQDVMQREKEKAFEELISIIGHNNISCKRDFHGRAIVIDNKVFIGSMDLDSYSLTGTRSEFALYSEDIESVRKIRNYFNKIFEPMKPELKIVAPTPQNKQNQQLSG